MTGRCIISFTQINEKVARFNALLITAAALAFIFTPAKWIIYPLGVDFIIRAFWNSAYSPVSMVSRTLLKFINAKPLMINAGPKIFSAKIGFTFCVVIGILNASGIDTGANITAGMLTFAAALEAFLGYCVGCKIYSLMYRTTSADNLGGGI